MEEWKEIEDYDGFYSVSSEGRVRSNARRIIRKNGIEQTFSERILRQSSVKKYLSVMLSKNGIQSRYYIHRLVANAFCKKYPGCNEINHIDENPKNNKASNLEWCDHNYNLNYGSHNNKISKAKSTAVIATCSDGTVKFFESTKEAAKDNNVSRAAIYTAIKKNSKSKGNKYKYYGIK